MIAGLQKLQKENHGCVSDFQLLDRKLLSAVSLNGKKVAWDTSRYQLREPVTLDVP